MDAVNLPIQYKYQGHLYRTAAKLEIAVSLDNPELKGIDMAELYFQSKELVSNQELNFINLKDLSERLLEAHADRTNNVRIEISFDAFKEKDTLGSEEKGLHAYPISLELVNASGDFDTIINFEILYASTCPCSEAASRQENLEKFEEFFATSKNPKKDFKDWYLDSQNSFAHPHAQKSKAAFSLVMSEYIENPVDFALDIIHELEDLIQTSVHAAVRQEDEAAFTAKMGDNLIFIEDAIKMLIIENITTRSWTL